MTKECINIVWLKRDLRTQNHLPLYEAAQQPLPYLIIFLFEPSIIQHQDTSLRHLQFQYHSILNMHETWKHKQHAVSILYTEAIDIFQFLLNKYDVKNVYSYQESGIETTYLRDKKVQQLFSTNNVVWKEFQRDGIVRGIKNRTGWDKKWFEKMHQPLIKNEYALDRNFTCSEFPLPSNFLKEINSYATSFQPAGETFALRYLQSFVQKRGQTYSKHISKPLSSRTSCSRLSPYISWGNLSIAQVYQFVRAETNSGKYKRSYSNFLARLKWHCHFMQKFEQECTYETKCINIGFEALQHQKNDSYINAWKTGNTGFPLVDACMRCLYETGWINFRMRAMLVSFFCHHLYQDWRNGVYHLAQLFLDYEPGIHYPQFQMQAGTTGINTIRMYNPIKQSLEHDTDGVFIKKWVKELTNVPTTFIHEPWKMTAMEQQLYNFYIGKDYPAPIINLQESGRIARTTIWNHRKNEMVKQENNRILNTHTRRKTQKEETLQQIFDMNFTK